MISIATPTHDPKWLLDAYRTLCWQTIKEFEWVLVLNRTSPDLVPPVIRQDPRVRLINVQDAAPNIGALKRLAFSNCTGSAIIELDHDDFLMPGKALQAVADAFQAGAGFVYSDAAVVDKELNPLGYSANVGFETYPIALYGRKLIATRAFTPISPRALCDVHYAPDHVRAWSQEAYRKAGGHDPKLQVGDDHELLCRTYLAGIEFRHTGGCHYLYRRHGENSFMLYNSEVQLASRTNREKYAGKLFREWCRREGHAILDLNAAIRDGWDWERDVLHGFRNLGYGMITCEDQLQFCPGERLEAFFEHCYDALLPGGCLEIIVPSALHAGGFMHGAKSFHSKASFLSYVHAKHYQGAECRFQLVQAFDLPQDAWQKEHDLVNLCVQLCSLKGQRQPGLCLI